MRKGLYKKIHFGEGEYISPRKMAAIQQLEWDLKLKLNINAEADLKLVIGRMREIEKQMQDKEPVKLWQVSPFNYNY